MNIFLPVIPVGQCPFLNFIYYPLHAFASILERWFLSWFREIGISKYFLPLCYMAADYPFVFSAKNFCTKSLYGRKSNVPYRFSTNFFCHYEECLRLRDSKMIIFSVWVPSIYRINDFAFVESSFFLQDFSDSFS